MHRTVVRNPILWLVVVLCAAAAVYWPGLSGGFQFDDTVNIEQNSLLRLRSLSPGALLAAATSSESGPLMRPLSMLSFALNRYFTGLDPYWFKLTNLVIHSLNGIALYVLGNLLLAALRRSGAPAPDPSVARWIALLAAACWVLHPLTVTSVLYVVQRMTSLSALFTIIGLALYLQTRLALDRDPAARWRMVAALIVFTLLAAACKEVGLLLPVFAALCEACLFRFRARDPAVARFVQRFFIAVVAVPAAVAAAIVVMRPELVLDGYHFRGYTLAQRLLTEARVLWFYARLVLLPDNRAMALHHDDFPMSQSLLDPPATALALAGLAGVVTAAVLLHRRLPLVAWGIGTFLAGHLLEATVVPLELVHEHRNYLPMFGLLLPVLAALVTPLVMKDTVRLRAGLAVLFVVALGTGTALRALAWSNPMLFAETEVAHRPASPRANYELARQYAWLIKGEKNPVNAEIDYQTALFYIKSALQARPDHLESRLGLLLLDFEHGVKPTDADVASAIEVVGTQRFTASLVQFTKALSACRADGRCPLPDQRTVELFDAALANPSLHGGNLAAVLTYASDFLAHRGHNLNDALQLARRAADTAPREPRYHLNLATLLMAAGRPEEARAEIDRSRELDHQREYAEEIRAKEAELARLRKEMSS